MFEYDYTVRISTLRLFFRDAVEYEYDEETQKDESFETTLHCYQEGVDKPIGGVYDSIRSYTVWYIQDKQLDVGNMNDIECVIEMPYEV